MLLIVLARNVLHNFEPRNRFFQGRKRIAVNTRNVQSGDETLFEKLSKRKWWLFGIVLVLAIGGTVVGSIYFTKARASTTI